MSSFITIKAPATAEIVVKKSRFIGRLFPVNTMEEAQEKLLTIKKEYWDARHNTSAIIIGTNGEYTHCSDDKEPQGTAGIPMLNMLKGASLTNILAVATRYFGGILLGTGGLVRAYSDCIAEAIKQAPLIEYRLFSVYAVTLPYELYGKAEASLLSLGARLEHVSYSNAISFDAYIPAPLEKKFSETMRELSSGKISPVFIEQTYFGVDL